MRFRNEKKGGENEKIIRHQRENAFSIRDYSPR